GGEAGAEIARRLRAEIPTVTEPESHLGAGVLGGEPEGRVEAGTPHARQGACDHHPIEPERLPAADLGREPGLHGAEPRGLEEDRERRAHCGPGSGRYQRARRSGFTPATKRTSRTQLRSVARTRPSLL